jgi:hypothetical protein
MTNNKQQTAVQLLFAEFRALSETSRFAGDDATANLIDFLCEREQQAKEMEKEQKANTWNNAINAVEKDKWESFEQYYNETYGGGNK